MGKLRQWFRKWFDNQIEKSIQRNADRQFLRGQNTKNVKD
tara:strand:- start:40 stop:159 length:120 start_codon:yes stop_codon:yes gene_type:complete